MNGSLGYSFLLTDDHRAEIRDEFGEKVLDSLDDKLEKKEKQFELVKRKEKLTSCFWGCVGGRGNQNFPYLKLTAADTSYRVYFCLIDSVEKLVFLNMVQKRGNEHRHKMANKFLEQIKRNPRQVVGHAKKILLEEDAY